MTIRGSMALFLLAFFLVPGTVQAETAEEKGLEISRESSNRSKGFGDFTAEMEMVLRNLQGEESRRRIRIRTLEVPGDGDKILMIFDTPKDVKGTAFLSFSHKVGDDDQWLYLPALKRVKRITSRNKSGSFMGSEFSYEDIASQELEKYTYRWIRDEVLDGEDCFVIERYPVDKENSGYIRQVVWLDKAEYRVRKVDFYDRKDSLLKTLVSSGYHPYKDRFWRPDRMVVTNHQNGKSTELNWTDYKFGTGLSDRDFDENALKRAR